MSDHDEVYGSERLERLKRALRELADRISELDRTGALLGAVPELQRRLGDLRSELFHYEVRCTYDTPEVAESRRLVEEARRPPEFSEPEPDPDDDEEPWRRT